MTYLDELQKVLTEINWDQVDELRDELKKLKGRLFILGVGGSAANASHAVNDFRKIANIEAYAPTDNVAEITARTNDDGWKTTFNSWLLTSKINSSDMVMVLSVGGGSLEASENIREAITDAKMGGATIVGIVGPDGGYTASEGHICINIPAKEHITPLTEAFQSIIWHKIVNEL